MKKLINILAAAAIMVFASCEDKAPTPDNPGGGTSPGKPLTVYNNVKLGFGDGKTTADVWVSFANGNLNTYRTVDKDDRTTQELIDMAISGYTYLRIAAPAGGPWSGSDMDWCKDWKVKKSTMITGLTKSEGVGDIRDFENIKTDTDLLAIYEKVKNSSSNAVTPNEGNSFFFRTEERISGIGFIHEVNGTAQSQTANTVISFKIIKP